MIKLTRSKVSKRIATISYTVIYTNGLVTSRKLTVLVLESAKPMERRKDRNGLAWLTSLTLKHLSKRKQIGYLALARLTRNRRNISATLTSVRINYMET